MKHVLRLLLWTTGRFTAIPSAVWQVLGMTAVICGVWGHGYWMGTKRCDPERLAAGTQASQHPSLPGTAIVTKQVPADTVFVPVYRTAKALNATVVAAGTAVIPGAVQTARSETTYVTNTRERVLIVSDSTTWGVLRGIVRAPASTDSALDVKLTYHRAPLRPVFGVYRRGDSTYVSVGGLPDTAVQVQGFADLEPPLPRWQRTAFVGVSPQGYVAGASIQLRVVSHVHLAAVATGVERTRSGSVAGGLSWSW